MNGEVCFVGGASAAGKTEITTILEEKFGMKRYKLKWALLEAGVRKGLDRSVIPDHYDILIKDATNILLNEVIPEYKRVVLDVHYGVQVNFSTSLARQQKTVEDLSEPYQSGIDRKLVKLLAQTVTKLGFILVVAPRSDILSRRIQRQAEGKPYRSLNPLSIDQEQGAELSWFNHYVNIARRARRTTFYERIRQGIVLNSDGSFEYAIEEIYKIFR
ncbi:hypothetical protein [Polycladomyces subterraneus]|uniref:NadR/Ttd14 AAA domain-containing protein n=1 Tax=Polycladomyces subterraneus TaxID=1016997 RepID=A0ABT8IRH5_9BACL|nr:hypothetical protein [Polycladomyces subterraneus]MDN4594689.1 hypothetical protein [Polycladomyces subterraneus]